MTMQVASAPATATLPDSPAGFAASSKVPAATVTPAVPAWMVDLKPALIGRLRAALADTTPGAATLSDRDVLARMELLTASGELTPEALLLFGTEHALAQAYPFLKTSVSRRDFDRFREKATDLPRNLVRQIDALLDFVRDEVPPAPETMQADRDGRATDQATRRDAALTPWIFEMALSRDYEQIKPARLVRDNTSLFLEYPRILEIRPENQDAFPPRYRVNKTLEAVLTRLYPQARLTTTMQAEGSEGAYFGSHPLRTEGRFFKTTALLPGSSPPSTAPAHRDHASPIPAPVPASGPGTMQAEGVKAASDVAPGPLPFSIPPVPAPTILPSSPPSPGDHPGVSERPRPSLRPQTPLRPSSPEPMPSRNAADRTARIVEFCRTPRNREEIQRYVGMNNRDHFRKDVLNRLIAQGLLAPTMPDKPNSPRQQYVTVSP